MQPRLLIWQCSLFSYVLITLNDDIKVVLSIFRESLFLQLKYTMPTLQILIFSRDTKTSHITAILLRFG